MRVHHLNCGTLCPRSARLINGTGGLLERGRMVCHCLLVELSDGLALIDTGFGTADLADPAGRLGAPFVALTAPVCRHEETALAQVARLGFHARDVRHILPTHLDVDHAGGITDFPDATVHLLTRERDAALARATLREARRYRPEQWAEALFQTHQPVGETWFGFESVRPLRGTDDEVLIIPLPGHTRGHAGIAVRTDSGWLLHAGDSYFSHGEVHATPPSCPLGLELFQHAVQVDRLRRLHNRDRVRELVRAHGSEVTVICAHCPVEFDAQTRRYGL